ncbi:hypothetical protein EDB19DRAFT_1737760 [Suillus lakei]|nr:hypothetical protein EDB19DRAFT_1737760 [Suillus lakei]
MWSRTSFIALSKAAVCFSVNSDSASTFSSSVAMGPPISAVIFSTSLLVLMVCSISCAIMAIALKALVWVAPREEDKLNSKMASDKFSRVPPPVDRIRPLVLRNFLAAGMVEMSVLMSVPSMYSFMVLLGVSKALL